jgi:hypothetical protein
VRMLAANSHSPDHPLYSGHDPRQTVENRRGLLSRVRDAVPRSVLPVLRLCRCSVESPLLTGAPLQDFALGPDGNRLINPDVRRIVRPPGGVKAILADLAQGLAAMHAIGVAHGDPALMNAFAANRGDKRPEGTSIDLNSLVPADADSEALDIAAFLLLTVWPALLDAQWYRRLVRRIGFRL